MVINPFEAAAAPAPEALGTGLFLPPSARDEREEMLHAMAVLIYKCRLRYRYDPFWHENSGRRAMEDWTSTPPRYSKKLRAAADACHARCLATVRRNA